MMPSLRHRLASIALAGLAGCSSAAAHAGGRTAIAPDAAPRVVALSPSALVAARARVRAGDPSLASAYAALRRDADRALAAPIVAVTDKRTLLPPSGDRHDYFSLSPYWWPDPAKPDGLPYIRRDGETNPESKRDLDQPRVAQMGGNAQTLALAYFFSGEERYAERAARQLRAWFLDSATRMTPHLRFSQLVRGNPEERGSGIIDTRWFIEAADAAALLAGSSAWSIDDQRALQAWMAQYATWLATSRNGQTEHAARNNHGSWYAAQLATLALFSGDTVTARRLVDETKARVGWQITRAGDQPIELERTRSFHYSGFNVEALSRLANIGRRLGVDLWTYESPDGGSLRRAIDHLAKYAPAPSTWPGQQIDDVDVAPLLLSLRRAQHAWGSPTYASTIARLDPRLTRDDRSLLLYPDAP